MIEKINLDHFYINPTTPHKNSQKTSQQGLQEGWTRVTFILKEDYIEKIKAIAYWDRTTIKDIMNEIVATYLENKKVEALRK